MTAEGFFHDAHEVYTIRNGDDMWLGTFRTKRMADDYVEWLSPSILLVYPDTVFEVRPV